MNKLFKDLGLSTNVLKSIDKLGYTKPSKIQEEIIPVILDGFDAIGQAQTGTGKTLAYASSVLSKIDVSTNFVKTIVLVPTRELENTTLENITVDYHPYQNTNVSALILRQI